MSPAVIVGTTPNRNNRAAPRLSLARRMHPPHLFQRTYICTVQRATLINHVERGISKPDKSFATMKPPGVALWHLAVCRYCVLPTIRSDLLANELLSTEPATAHTFSNAYRRESLIVISSCKELPTARQPRPTITSSGPANT